MSAGILFQKTNVSDLAVPHFIPWASGLGNEYFKKLLKEFLSLFV